MRIFHDQVANWEPGDLTHLSDGVELKRVASVEEDPPVKVFRVKFQACARTDWHSHSGVQLLYVVEGRCRAQSWGKPVEEVSAGDVIVVPPGEKHWHGASADSTMTHIAVNFNATTTWMEKVSDEEYRGEAALPPP